jgi:hypothetical protein
MSKKNLLLAGTLSFIFLVWACQKENNGKTENANGEPYSLNQALNDYAMTTNQVSNVEGVLCFENTETFDDVLESLKVLETNKDYVSAYLTTLGFSTDSDVDLTPFKPMVKKFNQRFNHTSLQAIWEQKERAHFNDGGEVETKPKNFILDLDFAGLLNQWGEVKVGNIIFKYIDRTKILAVLDGNFSTIKPFRDNNPLLLDVFPSNVLLLDCFFDEDMEILGKLMGTGCSHKVNIISTTGQGDNFDNYSIFPFLIIPSEMATSRPLPETMSLDYEVYDADGNLIYSSSSNSSTTNPPNYSNIDFSVPKSTKYPLNVVTKMTDSNVCGTVSGDEVKTKVDKDNCSLPNYHFWEPNLHKYDVELINPKPNVKYVWYVTIGTQTLTFPSVGFGSQTLDLSNLIGTNQSIKIILGEEGKSCTKVKNLTVSCGKKELFGGNTEIDPLNSNSKYELSAWIGRNNTVGISSIHYKKTWKWKRDKAELLAAVWEAPVTFGTSLPTFILNCNTVVGLPEPSPNPQQNVEKISTSTPKLKGSITSRPVDAVFTCQDDGSIIIRRITVN